MTEQHRSYYAIIPANVRYDKELAPNAKLLYGEITALCHERGYCWATNAYFAKQYSVSKKSVSNWINQLVEKGYVYSEIEYKEGTNEVLRRYLKIVDVPIEKKFNTYGKNVPEPTEENFPTPMEKKVKGNITVINNTNNNKNNKKTSRLKYEISDMNHAKLLFELMRFNNDTAKEPNFESWANEFRLIRERDQRTDEQIKFLIDWTQRHHFWKTNILSPSSLRKQWDKLVLQVKAEKEGGKNGRYSKWTTQGNESTSSTDYDNLSI